MRLGELRDLNAQGGKDKETNAKLAQLIPEIQKLTIEQLSAHLDSFPEHLRTKIANAVLEASKPAPTLIETLGGPAVLKSEIDRMSVDELAAYLAPLSENAKEKINAAVKDAAPVQQKVDAEVPQAGNPQEEIQKRQVSPDPDAVATAADIEILPPIAGKMDGNGGYGWWRCCTTAEAQNEIVMGRDM